MKLSAAIALAAVGGASAYSVNRSTLRSLGQRNVAATSQRNGRTNDIKMEGKRNKYTFSIIFGFFIISNKHLIFIFLNCLFKILASSREHLTVSTTPGLGMHASLRLPSKRYSTRKVFVTK